MTEREEQIYMQGQTAAWRSILSLALQRLGIDDPEAGKARWVVERTATIAALRSICERHGDNDWPDDLHLADVIEKHLARYLGE